MSGNDGDVSLFEAYTDTEIDMIENMAYDDDVAYAADEVREQILSDGEAATAVMEKALRLSHLYDKDQQVVANDIEFSFRHKYGQNPADYADWVSQNAPRG